MPRPCIALHELRPESCRWCHYCTADGEAARTLRRTWGEPEPDRPLVVPQRRPPGPTSAGPGGGAPFGRVPLPLVQLRLTLCRHCPDFDQQIGHCLARRTPRPPNASCPEQKCPHGMWPELPRGPRRLIYDMPDPAREDMPGPRPDNWHAAWPTREWHREHLLALLAADVPKPKLVDAPCIVYVGGGKYWLMIKLALRMARRVTDLPIQVWHQGAAEPVQPAEVAGLGGVTFHDITQLSHTLRKMGGWENKTTALLNCGYRHVLFIDADAHLATAPDDWLATCRQHGAAWWQDLPRAAQHVHWERFGVPNNLNVPPIQGGQLALDMRVYWRAIVVSHWLSQHSDYYYRWGYGDQDMHRVALACTGTPLGWMPVVQRSHPAFIGRCGTTVIVHRCGAKVWPGGAAPASLHLPCELEFMREWHMSEIGEGTAAEVFEAVYKKKVWGEDGGSGSGSNDFNLRPFALMFATLAKLAGWRSILDVGTGDGRALLAVGLPVKIGVDVYAPWMEKLAKEYNLIDWRVMDADAERERLPAADVCLVKDVLHHWPNLLIRSWLNWARERGPWRHVLVINSRGQPFDGADCPLGGWRPLDFDARPLREVEGLQYVGDYSDKQVVLLETATGVRMRQDEQRALKHLLAAPAAGPPWEPTSV